MSEFIDVPGGRIAYEVTGDPAGPLVVLAPGMGDLRGTYRHVAPALAAAGYRVVTTDLRGHGESTAGFASYSIGDSADDLAALLRHLGGGPAVVVGHSFSGGTAPLLAVREPSLVRGLALVGPFARPVPLNPVMKPLVRLVLSSPALWGMYYKSLYKGPRPDDFPAHLAALKANMRERGRMAAARAMGLDTKPELAGLLPKVSVPALIIMGTEDPDFPDARAEAAAVAAELGGPAEVVMVEGAGHYPHQEFPAETTEALLRFLRQVAPADDGVSA
ncbi:hydrolase [Actinomadura sp. NBRC 104425]|uniref:alpha/beta fold hydrolase n=1 Tax=Actinomadura sp. NBRC 104425 TaxID=3032204 RepID=UPI0024A5C6B7|nr:alpha/beta hydrolase [Actinomadura sp. NBRC 104425]GLZ16224.1 hydrolase [Actinomadura sp. NBRC 104425]